MTTAGPQPRRIRFLLLSLIALIGGCKQQVMIGSKAFTESVILGQITTDLAQRAQVDAVHRRQLGGTRLVWDALVKGQIDVYPEYTGTLRNEIFASQPLVNDSDLRTALSAHGIEMSRPLGFNDTYAIGMREELANQLGIKTISDLRMHPQLRLGFSNEFLDRADGWPAVRKTYQLPQTIMTGLDHDLAYRALAAGSIDAMDLYSTDAEIAYYHLRVLKDDRHCFPEYQAVLLYRSDLRQRAPQLIEAIKQLEGKIDQAQMIEMNAQAKLQKIPETEVAARFLSNSLHLQTNAAVTGFLRPLADRTAEHLQLVIVSLLAAIVVAIPLGVLAVWFPHVGQVIIGTVAAIYTIPSLALLVFMLPLLGIGWKPAVLALFLYSLLPIVRNTHAGLLQIPRPIRESAEALGLPPMSRLIRVELPLASPSILAGIQTSAVLNVGTATLGALIGAGGYGQPILTGIRLDNPHLILEGAVPAAVLALLVQGAFDLAGRWAIPKGLKLKRADD